MEKAAHGAWWLFCAGTYLKLYTYLGCNLHVITRLKMPTTCAWHVPWLWRLPTWKIILNTRQLKMGIKAEKLRS